jgi:hypothetical protein
MQNIVPVRIFRTFSANDWNRPESNFFSATFSDLSFKTASTFSSNAEKLRKFESQGIEEN